MKNGDLTPNGSRKYGKETDDELEGAKPNESEEDSLSVLHEPQDLHEALSREHISRLVWVSRSVIEVLMLYFSSLIRPLSYQLGG